MPDCKKGKDSMTTGQKITLLRKQKGLSQDRLADELSVSRQTISKWERDFALIDTEHAVALCKFFGVSLDDLLRSEASIELPTDRSDLEKESIKEGIVPSEKGADKKEFWAKRLFVLGIVLVVLGGFSCAASVALLILALSGGGTADGNFVVSDAVEDPVCDEPPLVKPSGGLIPLYAVLLAVGSLLLLAGIVLFLSRRREKAIEGGKM